MNISFDIFDIADFPIIITDKEFVIQYKNRLAKSIFGKLRKRSKISKHICNFQNGTVPSKIREVDIQTGTQFMRALLIPSAGGFYLFAFLSCIQVIKSEKLIEHINKFFGGDFLEFYISAYREHEELSASCGFESSRMPKRAHSDILELMRLYADKPEFMQTEAYDIAELAEKAARQLASALGALGYSVARAEISAEARLSCYSKINLREFTFILFRMVYLALRVSCDGRAYISLDSEDSRFAHICVHCRIPHGAHDLEASPLSALEAMLPELSLEFRLLEKFGFFENKAFFHAENSVLKFHYNIKREQGTEFVLRSEPAEIREKRIKAVFSYFISKTKRLLSKK